jgi:hypothetical protein
MQTRMVTCIYLRPLTYRNVQIHQATRPPFFLPPSLPAAPPSSSALSVPSPVSQIAFNNSQNLEFLSGFDLGISDLKRASLDAFAFPISNLTFQI